LAHVARVESLGHLTAALAHELSQPLASIRSHADAAEMLLTSQSTHPGDVRDCLEDIRRDSARAADILNRVRGMLQKEDGVRGPADLNGVVVDVLDILRTEADARGVTLDVDAAATPLVVLGDRVQLQQVVINLILNAFDALAAQPLGQRRVRVRTCIAGPELVELTVCDTGPGIPEPDRASLFEPFFSTKPHGLGIGLSITREIIEAHNGTVGLVVPGCGGTTLRLTLPLLGAVESAF